MLSWESNQLLAEGRWNEAAETALICRGDENPFARIHALVTLGLVRARRGDPGVWEPLDEAAALAKLRHELQWIAPVAIARAEAAWLEGRNKAAIAEGTSTAAGSRRQAGRCDFRPQAPRARRAQRSRGHRATTRANPAGLTPLELEVLTLLAGGLRNSEIADRLFVSPKIVDHHVSSILRKLGVPNRIQAVIEATRLGIASPNT